MIYTEITPNPASLKFVLSQRILPQGSADFPTVEETEDAPVAKKLFDFTFVERVFIGSNFITITKDESFQWEEIIPVVKDFLKAYLASGQDLVMGKYLEVSEAESSSKEDDEVTLKSNPFWRATSAQRLPWMEATSFTKTFKTELYV